MSESDARLALQGLDGVPTLDLVYLKPKSSPRVITIPGRDEKITIVEVNVYFAG